MLTWEDVPGYFDFGDIYSRMVAEAPVTGDHFVEIGVLFGRSALFMAETIRTSGKSIVFDAIDKMTDEARPQWRQEFASMAQALPSEAARVAAREVLERATGLADISKWYARETGLDKYINFHAESGQDRSRAYKTGDLGFVFIDSDHSYTDTKELLQAYWPRVRTGGVLAGHDYNHGEWPEVVRVVDELFYNQFKLSGGSWIVRKREPGPRRHFPW